MQDLYGLGARRIGILGLPNLGCVPSQRTLKGGFKRGCSDDENRASMLFNNKLSSQIDALGKLFPDARLVYLDIYSPLSDMIQNPTKYGNQTHLPYYIIVVYLHQLFDANDSTHNINFTSHLEFYYINENSVNNRVISLKW